MTYPKFCGEREIFLAKVRRCLSGLIMKSRATGRRTYSKFSWKFSSFGRGKGPLVCLVSGHRSDGQEFGALGVARIR